MTEADQNGQIGIKESNIETVISLGYNSLSDFTNKNVKYLDELEIDKSNLKENGILLSHFLGKLYKTAFEYSTPVSYTPRSFEKKIKKTIKSINKILKKGRASTKYTLRLLYPKNMVDYSLIVAAVNVQKKFIRPKRLSKKDQAKHKIEISKQNVNKFSLLYNKTNNVLKVDTKDNKFCNWILRYLQANSTQNIKDVSWHNAFDTITNNPNFEITEIKFGKTDVNQRDIIILKPTNPKTMPNLIEKLKENILKNPDLSYIERIGLRVPNGTTHYVDFTRMNELSIIPKMSRIKPSDEIEISKLKQLLGFEDRQALVDTQRDFLPDIFDNVGVRRQIKEFDLTKFSSYSVIDELKNKKIISLGEEYSYRCTSDVCHGRKFPSKKLIKRCKYCKKEGHLYYYKNTLIFPEYKNIRKELITKLVGQGINSKFVTRAIYSKQYEFILAAYENEDCLIYFNNEGLSKKNQEDFKIDIRPFVMLNFSGEPKSILNNYGRLTGGSVLKIILNGSIDILKTQMEESIKGYRKGLSDSLVASITKLEGIRDRNENSDTPQAKKGPMFEKLIRPVFSLLFKSRALSSKNKPDGVFFLNNTDYALWDAKRYDLDSNTLTKYIKKSCKNVQKDIEYIKAASGFDKILKRNLKFYIFITKGITETDFINARASLIKLLHKNNLSHVHVNCMDIDVLITLEKALLDGTIYENISKERDKFLKEFNSLLETSAFIKKPEMEELVEKFKTNTIEEKLNESTFTMTPTM